MNTKSDKQETRNKKQENGQKESVKNIKKNQ